MKKKKKKKKKTKWTSLETNLKNLVTVNHIGER